MRGERKRSDVDGFGFAWVKISSDVLGVTWPKFQVTEQPQRKIG